MSLEERPQRARRRKLQEARLDVFSGMTFSQVVMFAIIVATAATLGDGHGAQIASAADAAKALQPVAGHLASVLFAAGFIGSGLLAVPVLAGSASVGIAGLLGREWGFERSPRKAPVFYGLVALGTGDGVVLTHFFSNAIHLLVISALVNGVAAAPFMFVVVLISGDRELMGRQRNGVVASVLDVRVGPEAVAPDGSGDPGWVVYVREEMVSDESGPVESGLRDRFRALVEEHGGRYHRHPSP